MQFLQQIISLVPMLSGALVDAYGNPGACSGTCFAKDPAVIQRASDNTYFRFSTGGGIQVTKATSLSGPWSDEGYALPDGSSISVIGNNGSVIWAPDVHYINDTYYMYYAVSYMGSQTSVMGVATSTTLEAGSWTDHGSTGISSTNTTAYNAIDPNLINLNGTYTMNFGSFWHDIYQVRMSSLLEVGSASPSNIAFNASGTHNEEGSYMFYYEETGYYYLLISSGVCCDLETTLPSPGNEYRIIMCRSKSPSGGLVDESGTACTSSGGTTLLASHGDVYAPGGQGVFNDTRLGLVLYYHYENLSIGISNTDYQFGWNQIKWSNGWPTV